MPKSLSKPLQCLLQTVLQILVLLSLCSFAYAHTAQNLQALNFTVQGSAINAGSGTLALNIIQTTSSTSKESTQRDLLYQINQGAGSTSTDAQYNSLSYGTITVAAAQTTIQQGVNSGSASGTPRPGLVSPNTAASLQQLSSQPGMAWINDIQQQTAELAKNNPAAAAQIVVSTPANPHAH
jgi:hypothetical protein